LKKNPDGALTLYSQKDSPGRARESNWLPAPNGPIYLVTRLYWQKTEGAGAAMACICSKASPCSTTTC